MVTRINGFSGMDIDSLVKNMMSVKRVPLDKTSQSKDLLQWQRESYREINSKLYDFRNNKLSLTGYRSSAALNTQTAVLKDDSGLIVESKNSPVKATATATANGIPMKVNVAQLATARSLTVDSSLGSGYKTSQTLEEIMTKKYKDNALPAPSVPANFELSLNIDGVEKTLSFAKTTSLSSAITQINSDASLNVKASFDEITGQFKFESKSTGYTIPTPPELPDAIKVGAGSNSFLQLMSKNNSGNATSADGQNAVFSINGQVLNNTSNTVVYNGVELKFEGVTGSWSALKDPLDSTKYLLDADGNKTYNFSSPPSDNKALNITTTVDTSKALESVKAFINDYNTMLASFNTLINEEKFKDFPPLTSEQRSAMTESDITAWEKKAKSGLLKNDPILKSVVSDMRSAILEQLGPLSSMGITTGSYFENGKLYIDEAKFKAAVEANPQQLVTTLQGTATNTKDSIFGKFSTAMDNAMDKVAERAGTSKFDGSLSATFKTESVMGRQLKQYNNRISLLTTQLNDAETRYYKQFSAMEASMNKYQSQLAQLTGASS